jgi:hypothetical protein
VLCPKPICRFGSDLFGFAVEAKLVIREDSRGLERTVKRSGVERRVED